MKLPGPCTPVQLQGIVFYSMHCTDQQGAVNCRVDRGKSTMGKTDAPQHDPTLIPSGQGMTHAHSLQSWPRASRSPKAINSSIRSRPKFSMPRIPPRSRRGRYR